MLLLQLLQKGSSRILQNWLWVDTLLPGTVTSSSFKVKKRKTASGQFLGRGMADKSETILSQKVWVSVSQYRAISRVETSEDFLFPLLCTYLWWIQILFFLSLWEKINSYTYDLLHHTAFFTIILRCNVIASSMTTRRRVSAYVNTSSSARVKWFLHSMGLLIHSVLKRKLLQVMECVTIRKEKACPTNKQQLMGMSPNTNTERTIFKLFRKILYMFSFEKGTVRLRVQGKYWICIFTKVKKPSACIFHIDTLIDASNTVQLLEKKS